MMKGFNGYYGSGRYVMGGFGFLLGLLAIILLAALIVLAILLIVRLIRQSKTYHGNFSRTNQHASALEILNERFAKGEISAEDFQRMKSEILRP